MTQSKWHGTKVDGMRNGLKRRLVTVLGPSMSRPIYLHSVSLCSVCAVQLADNSPQVPTTTATRHPPSMSSSSLIRSCHADLNLVAGCGQPIAPRLRQPHAPASSWPSPLQSSRVFRPGQAGRPLH